MEISGALFDEECESFSTMFNNPKTFKHERSFTFPWDNIFSNFDYNSVNSFHDHLCVDNTFESTCFYGGLILADHAVEENLNSEEDMQLKRKYEEEQARNKYEDFSVECAKKNPRVSYVNTHKSKRKKKLMEDKSNANEEGISNGLNAQGSSCLNPDGKARGSRGSATDPQSLYARRRRERISERLRILQNLVPNGTKVDISTMLEEAAHYVKFLQLQIKLLSSDDMWMYAPIANNGMELGMFHKISVNLMD